MQAIASAPDTLTHGILVSPAEIPALVRETDQTSTTLASSWTPIHTLISLHHHYPDAEWPPLSGLQARTLAGGMAGLSAWLKAVPSWLTDFPALLAQTEDLPGSAALEILQTHLRILPKDLFVAFWDRIFKQASPDLSESALRLLQVRWPRELWFSGVGLDHHMAVDMGVLLFITADPWVQRGLYDAIENQIPQPVRARYPELQQPQWPLARHWLKVAFGELGAELAQLAFLSAREDPEIIRQGCLELLHLAHADAQS